MNPEVVKQMEIHARTTSGEVCGLVYEAKFIPLKNLSANPHQFSADPVELARALHRYGEPHAIFHTHPNGVLTPSLTDLNLWYYTNSTMIIGCVRNGRLEWKAHGNPRN